MKKSAVEPDWARIARAYARNDIGVEEICERFDIVRSTLYRRAHKEGWPLRQPSRSGSASAAASLRRARRFDLLTERLVRIIESYMQHLEDQIARPRALSAAKGEHTARIMTALAKLVATLADADRQDRSRNEANGGAQRKEAQLDTGDGNAARIREDLAERLARLGEQRDTG